MFKEVKLVSDLKPNCQYLGKLKSEYPWFTLQTNKREQLYTVNDDEEDRLVWPNIYYEFSDFKYLYELPQV